MNKLEFKVVIMESLMQALTEISAQEKSSEQTSIAAQILALQQKIVSAQKQIALLNQKKSAVAAQPITTTAMVTEDDIAGGKGDNLSESDVDPKELALGIKIEMEHTSDKELAKEIALDHLAEFKDYYTNLVKMEKNMKSKKVVKEDKKITELKNIIREIVIQLNNGKRN